MPSELRGIYDAKFYAGQLTPPESTEIGILARVLYERFHTEPVEKYGKSAPAVQESTVNSVLDIGCGMGRFLTEFRALGVGKTTGIEHPHLVRTVGAAALPLGVSYEFLDLEQPLPGVYLEAWVRYDLVLCLEVLEHLSPVKADQLALNIARLPGRLVISAAHCGHGGTGHINERPPDYWINKFGDFGRRFNMEDTLAVRQEFEEGCIKSHGKVKCQWYLQHLLVFDPVGR